MKLLSLSLLFIGALLFNTTIEAQTVYNYSGSKVDLNTDSIPEGEYHFKLKGGDGGWAKAGDCEAGGGNGAITEFRIAFGDGAGQIPTGSTIRLIVGGRGTNQDRSGSSNVGARGSGGGGTAVLARINNEWEILGVAGGGGGAYRGTALWFCTDNNPGQGGRSSTSGGDGEGTYGGNGGTNGNGGTGGGDATFGWTDFAGGGGGAFSDGTGSNNLDGSVHQLAGKKGLNKGGNGGNWNNIHIGGWGFGGGGSGDQGGGGGGGYSGGGGGSELDNGGGGGSYTNSTYTSNYSVVQGNSDMNTTHGYIEMTEICAVEINGFDYINPLCTSDAQGRIQFDYDYIGSSDCEDFVQWRLTPINGWKYLGDGIFRSMRVGNYTLTITNTGLGEVVTTYNFTVSVTDHPPVALCKDVTITLDEDGIYYNPNLEDLIDNGSYHEYCDENFNLFADHTTFYCEDIGENQVTLNVYPSNGVSGYCFATVTVAPHPNDLPIANCKPSFEVDLATQSSVHLSVNDINDHSVFASCHEDMNIDINTLTCEHAGQQVDITLTVEDQAGRTDECITTVNVLDSGNPTAVCKDNFTVTLAGNGTGTLNPLHLDLGSIPNNCTDLSWSADIVNFDCDDVGPNTVNMIVTDGYGRTSSCQTTVHIQESTVPVALCQDITIYLDEDGNYNFDPSEIDNGSNAGCSTTLSSAINAFDCDDLGDQLVMLTVTSAGNVQVTCEATVTVQDTISPDAGGLAITVALYGGVATIQQYQTQLYQLASDNCALVEFGLVGQTYFYCEDVDTEVISHVAVADQSGNTDTANITITVLNRPIHAVCSDLTVELADDGTYTLTDANINNILHSSTVGCYEVEHFNPIASQVNFDCGDVGIPVVVTMTMHQYGETSTCQSTITVVDNIDPYCNSIKVNPKAFLEGPYDSTNGLMSDELRRQGLIPSTSPFAGTGETVASDVLAITGNDAVVDWILIELRSAVDQSEVLYSQAALLLRDGDIVATNGISPVKFADATAEAYYIAIRHRNHLGVVTANTYSLSANSTSIDFSSGTTAVYGSNSQISLGGTLCLYGADTDGSGAIDASDRSNVWNSRNQNGYLDSDCNLDGTVNASDRNSAWNNRNLGRTLPD
ncbi:MAG: hypothetical protein AAF985_02385 [Bacteroidota bacterium]